jgi:hypothetical protein
MRPLPGALPEGAPLDNVGTRGTFLWSDSVPNIVKDGTPQEVRGRHARTGALSSACQAQR